MLALFAVPLLAQEPATLRWTAGEERTYLVQANFQSPYVLWLLAIENHEVGAAEVLLGAVVTCRLHTALKGASDVVCDATDASVLAVPLSRDRGRTLPILQEYEALYEQAEIRFRSTYDGRLRDVRLRGVDTSDDRAQYIAETARLFFERALAPLDLPLPEDPVEAGATWKYRSPLAGKMPVTLTVSGSFRFVERLNAVDGSVWTTGGEGTGLVAVGEDRWQLRYESERRFDAATGAVLTSTFGVFGEATAGSPIAAAREPVPYAIRATVERVPPGEPIPTLRPSGEL